MKKLIVLLAVAVSVTAVSCSSAPSVSRVDAGTQVDLSGKWNDTDVRTVCNSLIDACLTSSNVNRLVSEFRVSHDGANPTVIVGSFKNASSEHIDTSIISTMMQSVIINSGELDFVAGGDARNEIRAEREDQNSGYASDDSAAAIGNETGANFILQGSVKSIVDRAGNKSVRTYFVDASLTNLETNRIVWQDQNSEIKKEITQPKAKF
ncbi:MAG: penicillin-binding protein activator LpoB [Treponema sp.]|jgi:uncharacterized protein (TIGR02722 family)|nr:penicillin-binding protein activator LpoB [Treponema sp.]